MSQPARKYIVFSLLALVLAISAAVVLVPKGVAGDEVLLAETEQDSIAKAVAGYYDSRNQTFVVPASAVTAVLDRQDELALTSMPPVGEDEVHEWVLPKEARDILAAKRAGHLEEWCTDGYAAVQGRRDWVAMLDAGLYNNPNCPPVTEIETAVLGIDVKKTDGQTALVWALVWAGDTTTEGRSVQSWSIQEYALVMEGGCWQVDSDVLIGALTAASDEWGPSSPHDSMEQLQQFFNSALYPGEPIPIEELVSLTTLQ